jgi:hypothetical protein
MYFYLQHHSFCISSLVVYLILFLLFQKTKQKALFCFAESSGIQTFREAEPGVWRLALKETVYSSNKAFLFPEKEAKSVVLLRRRSWAPNLPRSGTRGVGGWPPKKPSIRRIRLFFFQKKKQKALFCFAEGPGLQTFREAEPRGFGGWPPKSHWYST